MLDINCLLAFGATYRRYSKGDIIFKENTDSLFYYQLCEGRIKLVNTHESGREYIQDFVESGESIGEIALLQHTKYLVTAITESDCVLIRLQKNDFYKLLEQFPSENYKLLQLVSHRLKLRMILLKELYNYSPTSRIKSFILYMKGNKKFVCPSTNRLLLTRQQLADMTGLRVETVIRTIKHLQREAIVQIDEKGKVYC